jgi:8-oxo-dGTP pyrophosphatase MutT (NUDIX family)
MVDPLAPLLSALARSSGASSDFDLNPDVRLPAGRKLRAAGVLIPIEMRADVPHVILTKRSSALKHHPGQISFPGGKQEEHDTDVVATALREAHEEIGLPPQKVKVLGSLPTHETVTSFVMSPVVGLITSEFSPRPEPGEVEEVFSVPLAHITDVTRFSIQGRRWRGQRRHYYTVPFGPYYIWGATARILRGLAERMSP